MLAVAVGMLYFTAEEEAVRLRREIRERRARMRRSRRLIAYLSTSIRFFPVCAALLSVIASCLKSTQVTTEASSIKWAEQVHIWECGAYLGTLNWNSTWSLSDDVSEVHKYRQVRILRNGFGLTLPISVAEEKRSFSKLKLIKTDLRSTMSQERLTGLAIISISQTVGAHIICEEAVAGRAFHT